MSTSIYDLVERYKQIERECQDQLREEQLVDSKQYKKASKYKYYVRTEDVYDKVMGYVAQHGSYEAAAAPFNATEGYLRHALERAWFPLDLLDRILLELNDYTTIDTIDWYRTVHLFDRIEKVDTHGEAT